MKKLLLSLLLISTFAFGQAPEGFNYQGVARDANGDILKNKSIAIKISLLQTTVTGTIVYSETHNPATNDYGVFSLEVGSGTVGSGDFSTVDWGADKYFIRIEMDINGGTNFDVISTTQLLSVPYALYAKEAGNSTTSSDADSDSTNELQTLSISNDTLSISDGNSVILTNTGTSVGGKSFLVLSGGITDADALALINSDFGENTQVVRIINTTELTSVDLSNITELVELDISGNSNLQSVDLSGLTSVHQSFYVFNNYNLTSISLSSLETINGDITFKESGLTSLNLSNLVTIIGDLDMRNLDNLISLDMTKLTSIGGDFLISKCSKLSTFTATSLNSVLSSFSLQYVGLTTLDFPSLQTIGYSFEIFNDSSLVSINLPQLDSISNTQAFYIYYNPVLTSITHPVTYLYSTDMVYYVINNALPSTQVNSILATLVAISPAPTNPSLYIEGQNPSAPPTGQGITDKTTLISNGWTVTTD
ncbi:MAG: hypothetical protein COC01_05925 [Bacteroidetes bacterium]|nr:MAG: hypothetical protein COC01_05925 [Bacteroidota bacterium]